MEISLLLFAILQIASSHVISGSRFLNNKREKKRKRKETIKET